MNQKLQNILEIILQSEKLDAEQKNNLVKAVKEADKEMEITAFKLERTEKVKKTTAILLEETIEELEQKRKAVEEQNHELEIEAALERVRAVAMGMNKPDDLLNICEVLFREFISLGFSELRNTMINIHNDDQKTFLNYDYSDEIGKSITPLDYNTHPVMEKQIKQSRAANDAFSEAVYKGKDLEEWKEFRRKYGEKDDPRIKNITALYYYFYSIGKGTIGISTFSPINKEKLTLLKRFRNVFSLAYQRYSDIALAEAQAREAKIEVSLERIRSRALGMHHSSEVKEVSNLLFSELKKMDINLSGFNIIVFDKNRDSFELWRAKQVAIPNEFESFSHKNMYDKLNHYLPGFVDEFESEWKSGKPYYMSRFTGEKRISFLKANSEIYDYSDEQLEKMKELYTDPILWYMVFFKQGWLGLICNENLSESDLLVSHRFAEVFEFAYTRFLDIQKAEAQARESEIQLALERVRARTMAMHKSAELSETSFVLFQQFVELGIVPNRFFIGIINENESMFDVWITKWGGKISSLNVQVNIEEPLQWNKAYKAWKANDKSLIVNIYGEDLIKWNKYLKGLGLDLYGSDENRKSVTRITNTFAIFSKGFIAITTPEATAMETVQLLERFASVFDGTYRRFLDLQKAETQAREAQIEAALERVRSRTMGMQHSSELRDASDLLFKQVLDLGVPAFSCGYNIWEKGEKECTAWMSDPSGGGINPAFKIPLTEDPNFIRFRESKQKKEEFYVLEMRGERMQEHYQYLRKTIPVFDEAFKNVEAAGLTLPETQIHHLVNFDHGNVMFITLEPCPGAHDIFKRFGKVFEQTYTRFLDLQKAEAQAREAQIEAALEKVRSRSLAMHTTNELGDVVTVIVEKLKELDVVLDANGVVLCTYFPDSKDVLHWIVSPDFSFNGSYLLPYFNHPIFNDAWQSKESGVEYFSKAFTVEEKNSFFEYAFEHSDYKLFPDEFKQWVFQNDKHILSFAWQKNSAILIPSHTGVVPSEDDVAILKRFAKVFEQSYVRFLDLQKSEIQAREAQIEAALERVRSRTMGMQRSNELKDSAMLLFQQIEALGVPVFGCGFNIWDEDRKAATAWMAGKDRFQPPFKTSSSEDIFLRIYEAAQRGEALFVEEQKGEALKNHYEYMISIPVFKEIADKMAQAGQSFPSFQIMHCAYFSQGYLMFISYEPVSYAYDIFKRFAKVFEQTYTRFLDLQKAEAQAREAVKQASLDRVRGKIASMRTAEDLNRITPIIWNELKTLEVPFIRCGVFIIDEEQGNTQVYLTTPEGKSLGVLNLSFEANELTTNTVEYWKKKQVYKEHWNKEEFITWTKSMMELGQVQNAETYQGSSTPPESLNLHFVPFAQGMLYVGDVSPLTDEKLDLVKTLAEAFSIAYARYEDFKQLEDAKNKIELTLQDLKSAQAQLVHSEKMASLGELTAGIAHEIKNPLNFVNNFSDLSRELIDEVKEELQKNNNKEVLAILEDLKLNLEKINQHGKRADSIVKGMLLHSRGSSGEKTLTDINDLLDQYVNLAYHGMRAQDKEFNITIEKDYDETLEKINVVPQDISRVFLNIINNACYAAYERKRKNSNNDFSPVLRISTKNLKGKAEIKIGDNGNGIPENIIDKIFQPFFTTKPTGEGTGLGLSLSYDIITKVHGGDLKVETKQGEGTQFIIQLSAK